MYLKADEVDYNEETGGAEARGNVRYHNFETLEDLECERLEYNLRDETGKFYNVRGSSPAKIEARQGILSSTNPFTFQGKWAERIKNSYILHDGFITNCKLPKPWWRLEGPTFDVRPGERAIGYNSVMRVRRVPIFYSPVFYKSLQKLPRRSGFLTPNIGNSSRRGKMFGGGYYWAINRSYDVMYRGQLFTQRGFAHLVDFRGKPTRTGDFNFILYGVNDRGLQLDNGERLKQGGFQLTFDGKTEIGKGFSGVAEITYLSSFAFRQSFTETFREAVFSEVHSRSYVFRNWNTYSLNFVYERSEIFNSTLPDDKIVLRKLPSVEFRSRDRQVWNRGLPLWVSFESSAGLLHRSEPLYRTSQFVDRWDVAPRITSALRWKDLHIIPFIGVRGTAYGQSIMLEPLPEDLDEWDLRRYPYGEQPVVSRRRIFRTSTEVGVDIQPPTLARVFKAPSWLGESVKHVIEPRAGFLWVDGIEKFNRIIRFDQLDIISNTNEAQLSVINRLFVKRKGNINELASWQITQARYFDPTFGNVLVDGRRNVVYTVAQLTGYTFLDAPRNYSPLINVFRLSPTPAVGVEWRMDYDPLRGHTTNSSLTVNGRVKSYFLALSHNQVRSSPVLSPSANQVMGLIGIGQENRRGWSTGVSVVYDYRLQVLQFMTAQLTYNSDCCGLSFQFRRFDFGIRQENQLRVAFVIANIGSFGTLRKQERMF
jgi:LPS-assembly protein